ncbi:hypothetical protein EYF80_053033 [Liparis tanakae]|uniref:Uncharacterized protein n=1 Tax=Liparis tanakae TaxID=230148 RepID=A0A4Z2F7D6_9TELE|nr:hypothetical protein EYF80_053033 [Liparis tanakae]
MSEAAGPRGSRSWGNRETLEDSSWGKSPSSKSNHQTPLQRRRREEQRGGLQLRLGGDQSVCLLLLLLLLLLV